MAPALHAEAVSLTVAAPSGPLAILSDVSLAVAPGEAVADLLFARRAARGGAPCCS